jgi:ubiquinone/menaquinone biosynthesis C-methylase UbiE
MSRINLIERIFTKFRILKRKFYNKEKALYIKHSKQFWDNYAPEIDKKWGQTQEDFAILSEIIFQVKPKVIFDFGCGSGRLFPLYLKYEIPKIIGQDISTNATQIATNRYNLNTITLTNSNIFDLSYKENYFDLTISNRTLQHIMPKDIKKVISRLVFFSNYIYINEMSNTDYIGNEYYIYKHDYEHLFSLCNCIPFLEGFIGKQKYVVFKKRV